jgi:hypothetical protein
VPSSFGNIRHKKVNEILKSMWQRSFFGAMHHTSCLMDDLKFRGNHVEYSQRKTDITLPIEIEKEQ